MVSRNLRFSLLLLAGLAPLAEAANIYRYVDQHGRTIYDSTIPPEYVRNGYTILNDRGKVVEVVPPAPTEAELAARAAAEAERQRQEEEARLQREADNLLVRLYRSPQEITAKRDDRLRLIESQRAVVETSVAKTEAEIERLEKIVANHAERGNEAPTEIREALHVQLEEKARYESHLVRLDEDMDTANADAERDIARLSHLLGLNE